jgi:hypothetical protein
MSEVAINEVVLKIAEAYYLSRCHLSKSAWKIADMGTKQEYITEAVKDLNGYYNYRKENE